MHINFTIMRIKLTMSRLIAGATAGKWVTHAKAPDLGSLMQDTPGSLARESRSAMSQLCQRCCCCWLTNRCNFSIRQTSCAEPHRHTQLVEIATGRATPTLGLELISLCGVRAFFLDTSGLYATFPLLPSFTLV